MSILDRIVEEKKAEVARLAGREAELRAKAESREAARPFALRGASVALIAEVKRRSPSAGWIRRGAEVAEVARAYESAGASAVSVLTDGRYFGGSLEDLERVRAAVRLPVLRKDFVLSPVQIWEARAAGADAVLLIARLLEPRQLEELLGVSTEAGVAALVEVHAGGELSAVLEAGATVVGINNRDLTTFRTDLEVTCRLAPAVPPEVTVVAESGIGGRSDVERVAAAGVDAVLVGESLMRADSPGAAVEGLVGAARVERRAEVG